MLFPNCPYADSSLSHIDLSCLMWRIFEANLRYPFWTTVLTLGTLALLIGIVVAYNHVDDVDD